jgi:ethanolamine utilization protein EutQ (cupin superfamily)
MIRATLLVCLALGRTIPALASDVFQLPVDGDPGVAPQVFSHPDGTRIEWAEVYKSEASQVAIGRSHLEGPLLPASVLPYTDCFYVARGTSKVLIDGKGYKVNAGDFILLPRGTRLEGRDFHDYVHFAASFETGPNMQSTGPKTIRRLHPDKLRDRDFKIEGEDMRHVYYEGAGGVVVRAWQSTQKDLTTEYFTSPWSELSFVVSGQTTITKEDGTMLSLRAGDAFFIAKGQKVKVTAHHLRKLAIVFDQTAALP